jgi:hypothetical protein
MVGGLSSNIHDPATSADVICAVRTQFNAAPAAGRNWGSVPFWEALYR